MKKMTIDGNTAASHVAYAFSEVAAIYPITPSSPMAESADEWATAGRTNMWGQPLLVSELQAESGAAGAVHGSLCAGALTTTYTASQGLLLMIPNMYKIAGELMPMVMHVSARAIAAASLNIFGDHSDVMACRQTGFAMMASGSVQEVMDLSLVSHLATLKCKVPFLHFFDGFRTSHEYSKIDAFDEADNYAEIRAIFDKLGMQKYVDDFKARALNPEHPIQKGTAQNSDTYFQTREACNKYYDETVSAVEEMMQVVSEHTGRQYHLFDYVGAPDAEEVIVLMGSGIETVEETVNKLNAMGKKVGAIKVRLYRPFVTDAFIKAIPATCKKMAVLDRTKEPGSLGEPLYLDVCTALLEKGVSGIQVVGGRYALGSKEFTPTMVKAIYKNLEAAQPKNHFTIGIYDDVTGTSLDFSEKFDAAPAGSTSCKFYGLGSDGTVGSNKNTVKIIGDHTEKYVQAYFFYDSKKSGGITVSHLRFGDKPIQSEYLIDSADFVACHNPSYVTRYDMVSDLKEGGIFLLNAAWTDVATLEKELPAKMKNALAAKKANLYVIDAIKIAHELGLRGKTSTILQSSFFMVNPQIMPYADAVEYMKKMAYKSFARKGDAIVQMNYNAIDSAAANLIKIDIPASWATTTEGAEMVKPADDKYFKEVVAPILALEGDKLPISAFTADGSVPTGTSKMEKRGVAVSVPDWNIDKCIQCNQCAFVCPHACIRPYLVENGTEVPAGFSTKAALQAPGYTFRIQVSPLDCMGCGVCVDVCPVNQTALKKAVAAGQKTAPDAECALTMKPLEQVAAKETDNWEFAQELPDVKPEVVAKMADVKKSQFTQPLFEFSGACAGCGETPYLKVLTQLFGDRMIVANATGCSSIYGGSSPTCPYTKNKQGHGPAWANSLFEDNAEFGFGMNLAYKARRNALKDKIAKLAELWTGDDKALCEAWIENMDDAEGSKTASAALVKALEGKMNCETCGALVKEIYDEKDCLVKKSFWMIGGDGWAYDIGYGGLDHVLAAGEDVNIIVLDTEVYSNTGGQASKSTPIAAVAKFAAGGKRVKKKDLGMIAASYGYVYVAQCAMGSDKAQFVKALKEAEAYKGPSIIICYAPCINHGINMAKSQAEEKNAVDCGYWALYRYNPTLADKGENPFILDSKEPTADFRTFILGETRYASLKKTAPELAEELYESTEKAFKARLEGYKKMSK
ncbi:MAG: pyruvate:ferredoxin (flavodoxin) oxidoreductase [Clostridia bacterium]|nr:pyruvate:ferredoxin (flavodoxin) oxidoreductase [Clostridia bacterium]